MGTVKNVEEDERWLCLSVDVQGYGARDDDAQHEVQRTLLEMLDVAGTRAGVDRTRWQRQPKGDEELALIPVDEAPQRVVGEFCLELDALLYRHNLRPGLAGRLRMRLAIDEGPVRMAANGFVGTAVVGASRLAASQAARQALEREPGANLVVVLSHGVYRDRVGNGRSVLPRAEFQRARISEKEIDEDAWLWVPAAAFSGPAPQVKAVPASPATPSGGTRSINQNGQYNQYFENAHEVHISDKL